MASRLYTLTIGVICALFLVGRANAAEPPSTNFSFPVIDSFATEDIGVDANSFAVIDDPEGGLLFGCQALVSFDGDRWRSTAIKGTYALRGLEFDARGRLWTAVTGDIGWFERTPSRDWQFHSLHDRLPLPDADLGEMWKVYADTFGPTFIAQNAILRWSGSAFQVWPMPRTRRLLGNRVGGTVYVHYVTPGDGIYAMTESGPDLVIPQHVFLDDDHAVLWMDRIGDDLLMATSRGLFFYRDGTLHPFAPEASEFLARERVISGIVLPDGRFLFGTYQGGIVIVRPDGGIDRFLTTDDGLPSNYIRSFHLDRQRGLWVTSASHIFRLDLWSATTVFDDRAGLPRQRYFRIVKSGDSTILGSDNGPYRLSPDTRHFAPLTGYRQRAADVAVDSAGVLVAGLRAVHRIQDGTVRAVYNTAFDVRLISFSKRHPGELLLADSERQIMASAPGEKPRTLVHGLATVATSMAEDDSGNLWLGTLNRGAYIARPSGRNSVGAQPIPESFGLPRLVGRIFVKASEAGTVFVVADNGGWLKPQGGDRFQPVVGFPAHLVEAVSDFADEQTAWIVHAATDGTAPVVARIAIREGRGAWEPHSVPRLEKVGFPRSILAEKSGSDGTTTLWVGGSSAVLRTVIGETLETPTPEPPLLRVNARARSGDKPEPVFAPLPYSTRSIDFEFAAPEFATRALLRLETKIEGIDPDWVRAGRDSRRELTSMRDGSYTFQVRTVAETGRVSAPTSFAFTVLPPWWRTAPAFAGLIIALLPAIYGVYAWRVRSLRLRNTELESKVRERTQQLQEASAAKTEFVANMSHDIRNPLNGIVGLTLALEDSQLNSKQRELVSTLRECTSYLSTLVDDVLDFASIEAGRVDLRVESLVPSELLRSVVTALQADAVTSGAALSFSVDPALPAHLAGDAGRIQQILVNYVSNALKYAGGSVHLSATSPIDSPDEVEFSVTDRGPGISANEQAALFTKFTRLGGAQHPDIPGTGLGLASCRLLADLMGGSVGVDSAPGRGARFYLRLPLKPASAPAEPTTGALPNTTVLLVEDTDYNALAATAVLGRLGLTCERARDGAEALRLFAAKRFNLVLLDRNLPDMDGTEIARRMRAMETEGAPAILLAVTAYCTTEDKKLCLDAGMDAFVGKPLTPEKLRKVLLTESRRLLGAPTIAAAPVANAAELDTTLLGYLSDGTEQGLAIQIERYLSELTAADAHLATALAAADFPRLRTAAHRLHGQATMIGATRVADAAYELESAALTGNLDLCRQALEKVKGETRGVMAALRHRYLATPGT